MAHIRVVGVGFDHMHIGDQLRLAQGHQDVEVVGVYDIAEHPDRATKVLHDLALDVPIFRDLRTLIEQTHPDIAFVCSSTSAHAELTETLAAAKVHVIAEKPMATSVAEACAMRDSARRHGTQLVVNWPLAWYPSHRECKRLIAAGAIGTLTETHFYDGNRGPLGHLHDKVARATNVAEKNGSWWYDPAAGGGSLRDYLGYGTTLGTWFRDGDMPHAITAAWHIPPGLRVDEQSVVIAHYAEGLSVFETRWGTFSDPWTRQPQPKCGFIVSGTEGAIASWDYADTVELHDQSGVHHLPVPEPVAEDRSALANLIAHLTTGRPIDPPMSSAISLAGQRMSEAAIESARSGATVQLVHRDDGA